jgi:hypothetical protein
VLNLRLRTTGKTVKGGNAAGVVEPADLQVSLSKMNAWLTRGTPERRALERVFSGDELKSLDLYRKRLEVLTRVNNPGTTAGDVIEMLNRVSRADSLTQIANLAQGHIQGGMIARFARYLRDNIVGAPGPKVFQLLTDAMLDPQLARTLLLKYTSDTAPVIERQLRTYLTSNLMAETGDRQQQR